MDVGILLNVNSQTVDPATLALAVEEAGFESFWAGDHPVIPVRTRSAMEGSGGEIPELYAHVADPFVVLGIMAGATKTLKLGTGICIVPARSPITTALAISSLEVFSGGRFLFGAGPGWLREELELLGVDHSRRLAQTREYVEAMRALWSDPEQAFEGEWVRFPRVRHNPRPLRPGGPKVLLGTWGPNAPRRIAEWADGWLPMQVSPQELKEQMARLREECEARDRDPDEIEVTLFEYDPGDDRDASQNFLAAYADAGADRVVLIQGLGDHMGSHQVADWTPEGYRDRLDEVSTRFL